MKKNVTIDVHPVTRIEGHGNIRVRIRDGRIEEARWDVVETPRFFEALMQGKEFTRVPVIASRICGICSISHTLASLRAVENALEVQIPETAAKLRLLGSHGETLQSHYLHLLFLAAPDFLGEDSVIPLAERNPEAVRTALRLKGLANRICDVVGGRTTHPVSFQVGGVAAAPGKEDLLRLGDDLRRSIDDLKTVEELFAAFELPDFVRETEFVSLEGEDEYAFIGGNLVSSDGVRKSEADYAAMTNEYVIDESTSKRSRLSREAYAVGALARLNNNFDALHHEAKKTAGRFDLKPVNHNPFMHLIAQLVECVHATHDAIRLIEDLTASPPGALRADVKVRAGEGVGAVEAPRGLLVHHYGIDDSGKLTKANCVVPTTQNNANIHLDLGALVARFAGEGVTDDQLEKLCLMLVRAYDPCLSCSVH